VVVWRGARAAELGRPSAAAPFAPPRWLGGAARAAQRRVLPSKNRVCGQARPFGALRGRNVARSTELTAMAAAWQ
jgi:hypothetical protein